MTITIDLPVEDIPEEVVKMFLIRKINELKRIYNTHKSIQQFQNKYADKLFESEEQLMDFLAEIDKNA